MATTRLLTESCPGMNVDRLKAVATFLKRQLTLDSMTTPGAMSLIIWIGFTAAYWGVAGWFISKRYSSSSPPSPSTPDESSESSSDESEKNRTICIALIIYFSLCILIVIFYAWRIKKFQGMGWDSLHPNNTFSGKSPSVTWGIMGFFTMGGLFISIILLCHYAGHDLHPSLIVVLVLMALLLSFTIALAGKIFVNCGKPELVMTGEEERCVKDFLIRQQKADLEAKKALIEAGRQAELAYESRKNLGESELIGEASTGLGVGVESASRQEAVASASRAATTAAATRTAAVTRGLQNLMEAASALPTS